MWSRRRIAGGQGKRRCVNASRQRNGGSMSDEINHDRRRFVGAAATTVAAAQFGVIAPAVANTRASKKVVRDVNGRSEAAGMDATVVLVHGAWADGSSWAHVIALLQSAGLKTMAAPIPLTS